MFDLTPQFKLYDVLMPSGRTIGGLARAAGVPVSTVRYYERRGLLTPDEWSRSRYRLYHEAALKRLRFIKAAQASGFSLEDVTALLDLRDQTGKPGPVVRAMIEARLADVRERRASLGQVQAALERALAECRRAGSGKKCPVIDGLSGCGEMRLTLHPSATPIMSGSNAGDRPRRGTNHFQHGA